MNPSRQTYKEAVESTAGHLVDECLDAVEDGEFDDVEQAIIETVSDDVEYHKFFAHDRGSMFYGSIIEHGTADPTMYSDWQSMIESDTPAETVKRLAYCQMEADVIEAAKEMAGKIKTA